MKFSPLCTRDEGREIYFTGSEFDRKYRFTLSREMLDDECGDTASEADRKAWVEAHMPGVISALKARTEGGRVTPPYNRVLVEELS